jgi:peptidoglycan/LPS O-acetylase OafA/YrhL
MDPGHTARVLGFGANGVALFFSLSGFLLSIPFWNAMIVPGKSSVRLRSYITRRILRIYPAYVVAVVIYAAFHDIHHTIAIRVMHILTHLLLIHNLSEATIYSLGVPLWSVATVFQM